MSRAVVISAVIWICAAVSLSAIPLSVLITQESEEIADTIRSFNKTCDGVGGGATEKQELGCRKKRRAIAEALARFVILAHEELDFLPEDLARHHAEQRRLKALNPDLRFDDSAEGDRQVIRRRKDVQLQVRWAQYWTSCLGRENARECKAEKAALEKKDYPFGRVGLAAPYPTRRGKEDARHWRRH